jgi:hypothetical protein
MLLLSTGRAVIRLSIGSLIRCNRSNTIKRGLADSTQVKLPADLEGLLPTLEELGLGSGDNGTSLSIQVLDQQGLMGSARSDVWRSRFFPSPPSACELGTSINLAFDTSRKRANIQPLNLHVIFMRNWDPLLSESEEESPISSSETFDLNYASTSKSSQGQGHQCEWERDWADVQRTTDYLRIPRERVRLIDFTKEYWTRVFEPAVGVWEDGGTPNPDVDCNR